MRKCIVIWSLIRGILARCEVQFDYGLRGKRSRPLKDRPRSFKSSKGKEITVAPEVEAKNDARTKGGRVRVRLLVGKVYDDLHIRRKSTKSWKGKL